MGKSAFYFISKIKGNRDQKTLSSVQAARADKNKKNVFTENS
jgi:hypothetical protein